MKGGAICEFGPDALPVIGPQVLARHCAVGSAFDGDAAINGDWSIPIGPVRNERWRNSKVAAKLHRRAALSVLKVFTKVHASHFSVTRNNCQALRAYTCFAFCD